MLQHTSMSVEEIRLMDAHDVDMHLRLLLEFRAIESELSAPPKRVKSAKEIMGQPNKGGGASRFTKHQQFDSTTGEFVDIN
jgi:hypothetical protein